MVACFFVFLFSLYAPLSAYQSLPPMDPQTQELLNRENAENQPAFETLPIDQTRKMVEEAIVASTVQVGSIKDKTIASKEGEFPIRIYTPFGKGPFPVFVFIHGGGWVFGSLNHYDDFCRKIATQAEAIVVSIGYRLAPEHPFPVPVEDCYAALQWTSKNIQEYNGIPSKIVIGGDSAGGNLTAACTLLAKEHNMTPCIAQILIYPITSSKLDSESYNRFGKNYVLTKSMMQWFFKLYVSNPIDAANPLVSPVMAKDLSNLPPAFVILANFDPLFSEGLQYAELLKKAQVPVTITEYPTLHGFVTEARDLDISKQATTDIATFLKKVFKTSNQHLSVQYELLDKAHFEKNIVGNTVVGTTPNGKNLYMLYFASNGKCELASKGKIYTGTWTMDSNDQGLPSVHALWPEYTSTNPKSLFNPKNPKYGKPTSVLYYQSSDLSNALLLMTKSGKNSATLVPGRQLAKIAE